MLCCFSMDYSLDRGQNQCRSCCEAQGNPSPEGLWGQQGQVEGASLQHPRVPGGTLINPGPICPGTDHTPVASYFPLLPKLLVSSSSGCHPQMPWRGMDTPAQAEVCLTFPDERPGQFCCPTFQSQARVALLWKMLPRERWEEFLEEAKLSTAVSLHQGSVGTCQPLAYTGWEYLKFPDLHDTGSTPLRTRPCVWTLPQQNRIWFVHFWCCFSKSEWRNWFLSPGVYYKHSSRALWFVDTGIVSAALLIQRVHTR